MSGNNPDLTTSKKEKQSKDASPQLKERDPGATGSSSFSRFDSVKVKSLSGLNKETVNLLLTKQRNAQEEVSRGFAEAAIPPGIYKEDGQTYWVCPNSLFNEDNYIGMMLYGFAQLAGAEIKTITAKANLTKIYSEKFIMGLWFGMFSSTNQKRRRGKKDYELGRTCTFSLIVKNVFESTKILGPRALVKDNFFFGNHAEEMFNKSRVPFLIKMKLRSFFEDATMGDLIYGMINQTAAAVGFENLTDEERDKVILDHLIPVDHLITSCYTTVTVKKGRSEVSKVRKPNPIRSSPLFLKEEMEFVSSITSLLFTDLGALTQNYEETVFDLGFDALERQIKDTIHARWETLQRFANRTKIRLQDIRKISNTPTLRKANVTRDHVNSLLTASANPVKRLVSEILHIIGHTSLTRAVAYAFKKKFANVQDATRFLYIQILEMYRSIDLQNSSMVGLRPEQPSADPIEIDFQKSIESMIKIQNKLGSIKKQSFMLQSIKTFKLYGRFTQLEGLFRSIESEIETLENQHVESQNSAVQFYSEGRYDSSKNFLKEIRGELNASQQQIRKTCSMRSITENDPKIKRLVDGFLINLESLDISRDTRNDKGV